MERLICLLLCASAGLSIAQTASNEVVTLRVTGDRVSLRSEPSLESYVLDSAMRGDELVYLSTSNGWVAVEAPQSLDFWVSDEFVEEGVVVPEKLNVRAGPSVNYAKMAELNKDDRVEVRGSFSDWLKIAPPKGSRVWISGEYVEFPAPAEPEAAPSEDPGQGAAAATPEGGDEQTPGQEMKPGQEALPPLVLVLDKERDQGVYVEIPGVLKRANPGLYKLVLIEGAWEEPICLVRGQERQMERYLNRTMLIKGKRYWAKDVDLPVVQPEKIVLDPLLSE